MSQTWAPSNKSNIPRQQLWSSDGTSIPLPKAELAYCSHLLLPPYSIPGCLVLRVSWSFIWSYGTEYIKSCKWMWVIHLMPEAISLEPLASWGSPVPSLMNTDSACPCWEFRLFSLQKFWSTPSWLSLGCPPVCWPPPMVLLPGNRTPLPGHSSCRQEGHLLLPQQDWSLWIVSYILPGVKRVCHMSTCPGMSCTAQLCDRSRIPVMQQYQFMPSLTRAKWSFELILPNKQHRDCITPVTRRHPMI